MVKGRMMFNRSLKRRVADLEEAVKRLLQEAACKDGKHDWTMEKSVRGGMPYIRCKHCWAWRPRR